LKAAAPKMVRVLWCPVRPNGMRSIMARLLSLRRSRRRWCPRSYRAPRAAAMPARTVYPPFTFRKAPVYPAC
ncbi:MAG TPA: hypothetical protein VFL91_04705, partial [Thermomicrobiales bacterium]|nr:hypothetical protein [Thermomicrobiales bacterium]